jgi:hypothetical protein
MIYGAVKLSLNRLRPAFIVVIGLILEPGLNRLRSRWWRRVPDPGGECRDTLRPVIERNLERSCQPTNLDMSAPLCLATLGVIPDSGHAGHPESGDRHTLQGNDPIEFAVGLHLEVPVPAKDSHDLPLPLLTSNRNFASSRVRPYAPAKPRAVPTTARRIPCPWTSLMILPWSAPSSEYRPQPFDRPCDLWVCNVRPSGFVR